MEIFFLRIDEIQEQIRRIKDEQFQVAKILVALTLLLHEEYIHY